MNTRQTSENTKSIFDFLSLESPTEEQHAALLAMESFVAPENEEDFMILCGAAGTGKTSITTALIGYLGHTEQAFRIAAPTARAARIIGRKSGAENSTIHSLIYDTIADPKTGTCEHRLKKTFIEDYTLYIIDEASMINAKPETNQLSLHKSTDSLLNHLATFIKKGNAKSKVLFLGDRNQLTPVHEDESMALQPDYLRQTFGWKGNMHVLTEVRRHSNNSDIMQMAKILREGIDSAKDVKDINIKQIGSAISNRDYAAQDYIIKMRQQGKENIIAIATSHLQNKWFNDTVRKTIFSDSAKPVEVGDWMLVTQKWSRNGLELFSGDHVEVLEVCYNDCRYEAGLRFVPVKLKATSLSGEDQIIQDLLLLDCLDYPGGTISQDKDLHLRAERNRKNVNYRDSGFPSDDPYVGAIRLTYGYSITCNKAQGGEWNTVYLNTFYAPSLKFLYTGVTRATTQTWLY